VTHNETNEPDFVLPNHDVIREDNWTEYAAQGFEAFVGHNPGSVELRFVQGLYGVRHVYTGDAWDETEQRPLHHKPGIGIYVDPEGLAIRAAEKEAERQVHQGGHGSEGDPARS
jgi:hypothetical protein